MGNWDVLIDEQQHIKAKRIIVVVVDAKPPYKYASGRKSKVPGLMNVMMNVSTLPMRNYSIKTVQEFAMRLGENKTANQNFATLKKLCDQVHKTEVARNSCYQQFIGPFGGFHAGGYFAA